MYTIPKGYCKQTLPRVLQSHGSLKYVIGATQVSMTSIGATSSSAFLCITLHVQSADLTHTHICISIHIEKIF